MKLSLLNRKVHHWGSIVIAVPLSIVLVTGLLLLLKKDVDWIQPPTARSPAPALALSFDDILKAAQGVPEAKISSWDDVNRLDVRPGKGIVKVRAENSWEVQLDAKTGAVLQVAYRRSDLIESIHDGSFFADFAKLGIFLPAAVLVTIMWITGMILFFQPYWVKSKKKKKARSG